jgi:hypothetical protein
MSAKHKEIHHHNHGHATTVTPMNQPFVKTAPARYEVGPEEQSRLICVRAYSMWEAAGRPNSYEDQQRFWLDAEREYKADQAREEVATS